MDAKQLSELLHNALIQPHFNYGVSSPEHHGNPLLSKALKTKLQIAQNKCMHLFLLGASALWSYKPI